MFYDKRKKEELDKLTIKYVLPKIKEEVQKKSKQKDVIMDVPLLFETGLDKFCDMTIGVIAKPDTCIERICKRDNISKDMAFARLKSQNNEKYFKINCDFCISNNEEDNIEMQIKEIFSRRKFIK